MRTGSALVIATHTYIATCIQIVHETLLHLYHVHVHVYSYTLIQNGISAEVMKQSQQRGTSIPCMPISYLSYCTVYSTRIRTYIHTYDIVQLCPVVWHMYGSRQDRLLTNKRA